MPPVAIVLIVAVALVLLVLAMIAANKREQERRAALAQLAADLDCDFAPDRDTSHDDLYSQFSIFRQGHSRTAMNTIQGTIAHADTPYLLRMGDFQYKITTSNGKTTTTTTYRLSYLILHPPMGPIPDLLIRPEGLFDKLAGAFGLDDIDFESAEFSKRFFVKSDNKKFAYDVVTPAMMEFLLASDRRTLCIEDSVCLVTTGTRRWSPDEFRSNLDWTLRFFDLWPTYLVEDLTA